MRTASVVLFCICELNEIKLLEKLRYKDVRKKD